MKTKLKTYQWDEVDGETSEVELEVHEEASPKQILDQINQDVPHSDYDREMLTEFAGLTLWTGRWGRDRQYAVWWGPDAAKFAEITRNVD